MNNQDTEFRLLVALGDVCSGTDFATLENFSPKDGNETFLRRLHGVRTQKNTLNIFIAMRTSSLT
jgi:hypothetical protein